MSLSRKGSHRYIYLVAFQFKFRPLIMCIVFVLSIVFKILGQLGGGGGCLLT